jgi:epoxyqueuosine reductase
VISAARVKQCALEAGFDLAGIAPLPPAEDLEFSRRWVDKGFAGEMQYLRNPKRDDPRRVLSSARSAVCVGLIYNAPLPYSTDGGPAQTPSHTGEALPPLPSLGPPGSGGPRGWISRYAWGSDYHFLMRERLERLRKAIEALVPAAETRLYVDTGPINERTFARYSGIGWVGKNTLIINQRKGSWFFLGVVLTNLDLAPDLPAPDRCGSCTRCIEACPTQAFVRPYVMDASRCIAYFTIELKGSIPEELRPGIGRNVFGCDICQDVCPWNSRASGLEAASRDVPAAGRSSVAVTKIPEFQPLGVKSQSETPIPASKPFSLFNPPLEELTSLTEDGFRRAFRSSPIKRAKYRGWLRNLCVAMGNSGDRRFLPWLESHLEHPDGLVQEHAAWALQRLTAGNTNREGTVRFTRKPNRKNPT